MIRVKVPATTANLGPCFDCMGLAFELYNHFHIDTTPSGLTIEGGDKAFHNDRNLVYQGIKRVYEKAGRPLPGIYIKHENYIPLTRGLGSSSTCIVAGAVAANYFLQNYFSDDQMLDIVTEIEGHPDNVAPAYLGGLVFGFTSESGRLFYRKNKVDDIFRFIAYIPNFTLSTTLAREILPKTIDFKDAVFNLSRSIGTFVALRDGNIDLLVESGRDRLHQPYRKEMLHEFEAIQTIAAKEGAYTTVISGAGPTVISFFNKDYAVTDGLKKNISALQNNWQIIPLEVNYSGYSIE